MDYLLAAATTWSLGFIPIFEFYVAVPAGMGLGLSAFSATLWTTLGNYLPVPLIHFGMEWLRSNPRIAEWLDGLVSEKWRARLQSGGPIVIVTLLPLIGTWVLAATLKVVGLRTRTVLIWPLVAVVLWSGLTATLIALGVAVVS